jgi:hypothetical protein
MMNTSVIRPAEASTRGSRRNSAVALCSTGSIVGVAEAPISARQAGPARRSGPDPCGVPVVLVPDRAHDFIRLRPCQDLPVEKRLHRRPNSLAAEGVAAIAARSAMAGSASSINLSFLGLNHGTRFGPVGYFAQNLNGG